MPLFYVVREIFVLENAVSFNFALDAPYVIYKRRVKSCRSASATPTTSVYYRRSRALLNAPAVLAMLLTGVAPLLTTDTPWLVRKGDTWGNLCDFKF